MGNYKRFLSHPRKRGKLSRVHKVIEEKKRTRRFVTDILNSVLDGVFESKETISERLPHLHESLRAAAAANNGHLDNLLNGVKCEPEQPKVESCENFQDTPTTSTIVKPPSKLEETRECPTYNASYINLPDVSDSEDAPTYVEISDPLPSDNAFHDDTNEPSGIPFMALSVNANSNFTIKSTTDKTIPLLIINLYHLCEKPEEYAKLFEKAITIDIAPTTKDGGKVDVRKPSKANKENKKTAPLRGHCLFQFDLPKNKSVASPPSPPIDQKKSHTKIAKVTRGKVSTRSEKIVKRIVEKPQPLKKEEKLTAKRSAAPPLPVEVVVPKRIKAAPLTVIDVPNQNLIDPNISDPFADIPQLPSLNILEPVEIKQEIDETDLQMIDVNDTEIHPSCIKSEPLIDIPASESAASVHLPIILNHIMNPAGTRAKDPLSTAPTSTTSKTLPGDVPGVSNDMKRCFIKVKNNSGVKLMCSVCRAVIVGNPVDHLKTCTVYKY